MFELVLDILALVLITYVVRAQDEFSLADLNEPDSCPYYSAQPNLNNTKVIYSRGYSIKLDYTQVVNI